jgi:molecular chaperone DnaJ
MIRAALAKPPMPRDYYAVLEVSVSSTHVQIRQAYQRLARRYSPDVNFLDRDTEALFEEIVEAYRVLSNPTARTLYDRGPVVGEGSERPGGCSRPMAGRRGESLHVPVELSFQQAALGVAIDVVVERLSPCRACRATGLRPGAAAVRCGHCGGTGAVWADRGSIAPETCPVCDGAGERVSDPCSECRGRGARPETATVAVAIPAGVDTGVQLRVPGEGHAGPFGGPRGELMVVTRVREDTAFTRKGDNLYTELAVSVVEAVLGVKAKVLTLEGTAEVVVPPGTQSGQVLRLRGRGLPRLSGEGRGDLYVTVRVAIPRGIDARTQELFREIGRLLPASPREEARA